MPLWVMAKKKVVEKGYSAKLCMIHLPFLSSAPASPELGVCQDETAFHDHILMKMVIITIKFNEIKTKNMARGRGGQMGF